jgi:hypothetical protein
MEEEFSPVDIPLSVEGTTRVKKIKTTMERSWSF